MTNEEVEALLKEIERDVDVDEEAEFYYEAASNHGDIRHIIYQQMKHVTM